MKVPKGKTVYYGGKKLKEGDEIPDSIAKKMEEKIKKPAKSKSVSLDKDTILP